MTTRTGNSVRPGSMRLFLFRRLQNRLNFYLLSNKYPLMRAISKSPIHNISDSYVNHSG